MKNQSLPAVSFELGKLIKVKDSEEKIVPAINNPGNPQVYSYNYEIIFTPVGKLGLGKYELKVAVSSKEKDKIFCIAVDGNKHVSLRKMLPTDEEGVEYCKTKIMVKEGNDKTHHTEPVENNIRFLRILGKGAMELWEVALISQGGSFFITAQCVYNFRCYRNNNDGVLCPQFERWPEMIVLVESLILLYGDVKELPSINGYMPKKNKVDGFNGQLDEKTAITDWFNLVNGYGAARSRFGARRVHWSELPKRKGLAFLLKNEKFIYKKAILPKNTKANKTAFKRELVGCSLI
ncbi:MAG: hypothetical protein WC795_01315 [Candidatus Paceibacterota bacterium]